MGMTEQQLNADTIPAPPPFKACGCGRGFTPPEWAMLPHVGVYVDEVEYQDWRNCHCGSTLAVVLEGGAG